MKEVSGTATAKRKASYEVHFRCLKDKALFFRYETDEADGFIPRTGEIVFLPGKGQDHPGRDYKVTQVTTVIYNLMVDETYRSPTAV